MATALDGVRVLDLSGRLAGAYASRLLGDFGAEVWLGEPPEGHALRREPPFLDASPGGSLLHEYANLNKQSIALDAPREAGRLAAAADVLVTTAVPPWPAVVEAAARALPADAVHLSLTPHGLDGPLATVPGNDLTASARSGWADMNGFQGEPPLQHPPLQASYLAGVLGYVGVAGALHGACRDGVGQLIDMSETEAMTLTAAPWLLAAAYEGPDGQSARVHRRQLDSGAPIYRARDGRVFAALGGIGGTWQDAMRVLGLSDVAADERYQDPEARREAQQELTALVAKQIASLSRYEVFERLGSTGSVTGVVQTAADLLNSSQLETRGYFGKTMVGEQRLRVPAVSAQLSVTPPSVRTSAPRLDEHRSRIIASAEGGARAPRPTVEAARAPLAGIRVLTFTQAWSGPWGTELLALLGADVVQIEARRRPDIWRAFAAGFDSPFPSGVRDPSKRQRPLNTQALYNAINLNKRGITLDMTIPEGQALFWRLVPRFDVVAENFNVDVMDKLGVTFERLRARRPDVVYASLNGHGGTGPYAGFTATGGSIEPMSGLTSLHGYAGGLPQNTGGLFPDPVGGCYLAAAIISAIHHRDRTGEGQSIDVSMTEAMAMHVGDAVLEYGANGVIRGPQGNRHPRIAPHGIYQASADAWIAIATETDEAWQALATVLGRSDLASDRRLDSMGGRKQHEDEIDAAIGEWAATQQAGPAADRLGAVGVTAARVLPLEEVYQPPAAHLLERGFAVEVEHPEAGTHWFPRAPWMLRGTPIADPRYSPMFGEHSFEVLSEELGVSRAEYEHLVAIGVTGETAPE